MAYVWRSLAGFLAVAGLAATFSTPADAKAHRRHFTQAPPRDIIALYAGKTWNWSKGAGYFSPDFQFAGWSGRGKRVESVAMGRWFVTPTAMMCFKATWQTQKEKGEHTTCFDHRMVGATIYQRRAPHGVWYPFQANAWVVARRGPTLVTGDRVSTKVRPLNIGDAHAPAGGA
jgi:hypothetical protein